MRQYSEIRNQPCRLKLKDFTETVTSQPQNIIAGETPGTQKVKKIIQKTDENGQPLFKIIQTTKQVGCGCGGKPKQTVVEEQKVPDTIEVWVEEPLPVQQVQPAAITTQERRVLCRVYGTIPESYCLSCKIYQK